MKTKPTPLTLLSLIAFLSLNAAIENTPSPAAPAEAEQLVTQKTYAGKEIRYFGPIIIKNENIQNQKFLIYGTAHLENSTFKKDVTCYGSLNATSCVFYDDVEVSGSLNASQCTFNDDLEVSGDTFLDTCDCKKGLSIRGNLKAIRSTLNNIFISTTQLTLTNSIVNNIKIKQDGSTLADQHLYLDNTTIKSDVTFDSDNGKIHLKGNTKINGKVKGGSIVKE